MAENPLAAATDMKPRTLLLVVGGGVVAGVAWRMWSNRSGGNRVLPDAVTATDDDYLNLGFAGEGAYAGSEDRRDVYGSGINLPVSEWIIRDTQGNRYLTDGTNITPLDDNPNVATPNTPTAPPSATQNQWAMAGLPAFAAEMDRDTFLQWARGDADVLKNPMVQAGIQARKATGQ